jgi:serine/threonine-protein kinase
MSPEQMESPRAVDTRTDIWSLGVVLYQLLTGEVPFAGETLPQVCVNVATRSPALLRKYRPDAPSGLEAIVQRCLEKDPAKRFQSIAALATALARFGSRRAQTSLDRIMRIEQKLADVSEGELVTHERGPTDRPVTGPIPSWGGTAKRLQKRTRNILGWSATAFSVVAVAATWARQTWAPGPSSEGAVLVTPSRSAGSSESAAAAEPPLASPQPPSASPPSAPLSTSTLNAPPRLAASNRLPVTTAPRAELARPNLARPNLAPIPLSDEEINPYLPLLEAGKSSNVGETCSLNLEATPAARVEVDEMPLGFTPKMSVAVPVGEHRVRFHWADVGDKREVISCTRGETKTVSVRLSGQLPSEELPEKNPYR